MLRGKVAEEDDKSEGGAKEERRRSKVMQRPSTPTSFLRHAFASSPWHQRYVATRVRRFEDGWEGENEDLRTE
eukprot:gene1470-4629_t